MKPRKDKINEATASYHYVADNFQQFESTKAAIKFMKESHQYSDQDIAKLEAKIVSEAKKLCPDKYEWLEGDDNIQVCTSELCFIQGDHKRRTKSRAIMIEIIMELIDYLLIFKLQLFGIERYKLGFLKCQTQLSNVPL